MRLIGRASVEHNVHNKTIINNEFKKEKHKKTNILNP
jgi:hypothetical protein